MPTLSVIPVAPTLESVFRINSFLIRGKDTVAIVNAQFEASRAAAVADAAEATGLPVSEIVITHSDPDFYFGTAVLAARFPDATIIASPSTAALIAANNEGKQAIWNPQLGDEAPTSIQIPTAVEGSFTVAGIGAEFLSLPTDQDHSVLWIPSERIAIGGIYLTEGSHLWLADSRPAFARSLWSQSLHDLLVRDTQAVYPSHSVSEVPTEGFGTEIISATIDYLRVVEEALHTGDSTDSITAIIDAAYPDLPGKEALSTGIGVIRGEVDWETLSTYIGAGHRWIVDFGPFAFTLDYTVPGQLTFVGIKGEGMEGLTDTMPYEYRLIGPATYLVTWQESLGARVAHVQDFASGIVYTNIAQPDGSYVRLPGTLRPAR